MRLYFFGDSICFGQFVSPHRTWVHQVALHFENIGVGVTVQNPSVNGRTTRQALEDMPFQVQAHGPEIIYIQFGMNDCNYWATDNGVPRVSEAAFAGNLKEIVQRGRSAGAKLIFLATNHPTPRHAKFDGLDVSYQDSNKKYNEIIRKTAAETRVILVDHEVDWCDNHIGNNYSLNDLVLADGVHLSEAGHILYAQLALKIVAAAVAQFFPRGQSVDGQ